MRFDIIGAGRVGKNFAKFLANNGHEIGHVVNSSLDSSKEAVKFIGKGIPASIQEVGECDVVLIGTPDDEIRSTFLKFYQNIEGVKAVGHFSGAYSSYLLRECDSLGIGRFSVHPNASFADPNFWKKFSDVYFVLEGNEKGKEVITSLLSSLNLKYGEIEKDKKLFYHSAAVFASNFVVALMAVSRELYSISGLDEEMAENISLYLAKQAVENVEKLGVKKAITGPVARGDIRLVRAEEMVLQDTLPDIGSIYHKFVRILRERVIESEREKINGDEE
jgi:predicted short-subunit dehydrogenase-like oxidoreductase (DUF2520 family)